MKNIVKSMVRAAYGGIALVCFGCMLLSLLSCSGGGRGDASEGERAEDLRAKEMLQGVWVNADDGDPAFRAQGDTIFYPDSVSMPVSFQIFDDTLVLHGKTDVSYAIVRQSAYLFDFRNQNGEVVRLKKSDEEADAVEFSRSQPLPVNQGRLIKRDTVFLVGGERYHCYVQVNPTTYKVYKTTYNDEGVSVENIYYDNIINLAVYNGRRKVFSSDFHKSDFRRHVDEEQLRQCILSDMLFNRVDADGIHYDAFISIPDSPIGHVVDVRVAYDGKVEFSS